MPIRRDHSQNSEGLYRLTFSCPEDRRMFLCCETARLRFVFAAEHPKSGLLTDCSMSTTRTGEKIVLPVLLPMI
jgi:hypothetical protein